MEQNTTSADNQQVIDDHLERVVQDFNEFQDKILQSGTTGTMKLEELVDLYICSGGDCVHTGTSPVTEQVSEDHLENVLQDFNKFRERISLSSSTDGMKLEELMDLYICNSGDNTNLQIGKVFDSEKTLKMEGHGTSHSFNDRVTHIRYGELNCHKAAIEIIGGVMGGDVGLAFKLVERFYAKNTTPTRKRIKRKYKSKVVKDLQEK